MHWEKLLEDVANHKPSESSFIRRESGNLFSMRKQRTEKTEGKKGVRFSRREAECMKILLEGDTMRECAEKLGLSPRTVESYAKNMKEKAGCRTKAELIRIVKDGSFVLLLEDDQAEAAE